MADDKKQQEELTDEEKKDLGQYEAKPEGGGTPSTMGAAARWLGQVPGAVREMAGEAYRRAITPPPPKLPPQRPPQETMKAQPGFMGRLAEAATQQAGMGYDPEGRLREVPRGKPPLEAMFEERYTPAGERESPILSRTSELARRAGQFGNIVGTTGMILDPLLEEATAARAATLPRARAVPRETAPPAAAADLRPLPGPVQGPHLPTAGEQLEPISQQMFGKSYNDLDMPQQIEVTKRIGATGARRVQPGESPTGMERRAVPGELDRPERRIQDIGPPPGSPEARARQEVDEARGANYPRSDVYDEWRQQERRRIDQAVEQERRAPGSTVPGGGLPPMPAPTILPGGAAREARPSGATLPTTAPPGAPPAEQPGLPKVKPPPK